MESFNLMNEERCLTVGYARQCVRYEVGKLLWNARPIEHFASRKSYLAWHTKFQDKECGSSNSKIDRLSYLRLGISINGKVKLFLVHRVIWAVVHGRFPSKFIDHIDGDVRNNEISNLRDVSNQDNTKNSKMYSHNTSGITGVSWDTKWKMWRIQGGGINTGTYEYLGITKNLFEAACVRRSWELINGYSERHGK